MHLGLRATHDMGVKGWAHVLCKLCERRFHLLLEELCEELARQEYLVISQAVGVVLAALEVGERVEFVQHLEEERELGVVVAQVHKDAVPQQAAPHLHERNRVAVRTRCS